MRVGVDMLYAQSAAALHGIGNYSFSHIMHLAHHPDVEIYYFEPIYEGLSETKYVEQLSRFIKDNDLDILHFPSPMQVPYPEVFLRNELPAVRLTALVHDIIPLVYPEHHLKSDRAKRRYQLYLDMLRKMDHLFTNSEYTRQDLIRIGFKSSFITSVSAGRDDCSFSVKRAKIDDLKGRFPVRDPFVLAFTPWDFRKNAERLVEAYGRATRDKHRAWQIVFVNGEPSDEVRSRLDAIAREHGIPGRIRYAGRVTKSQLLRMYHRARAVAMPTLYEGFGLPALEGMQCGTPVLTSNTASMPEVVGNAAIQVNPLDVGDIEDGLRKVLFDRSVRKTLKVEGIKRASTFRWEDVADRTVEQFHRLMRKVPLRRRKRLSPRRYKIRLRPVQYAVVKKGVKRRGRRGSYFTFNLTELSRNVVIRKAVLRIVIPRRARSIGVHKIMSRWNEEKIHSRTPRIRTHPTRRARLKRKRRNCEYVLKCRCTRLAQRWRKKKHGNRGVFVPVATSRRPSLVLTLKRRGRRAK